MNRTWHQLQFPRDFATDGVLGFARSLAIRPRHGLLQISDPVILEAHGTAHSLQWRLGMSVRETPFVLAQLRTHVPGVRVAPFEPIDDPPVRATELRLSSARRPVRSDTEMHIAASLLTALRHARGDEWIRLQLVIGPWLPRPLVKRNGIWQGAFGFERLRLRQPLDADDARALLQKYGEPLLGTVCRVGVSAQGAARQRQLIQGVVGALQLTRQPGVGFVGRCFSNRRAVRRMHRVATPLIDWPAPLNARELVSVIGWPVGGPVISGITYQSSRQLPPVADAVVSERTLAASPPGRYRVIGRSSYGGETSSFVHLPIHDARHGMWIVGPNGSGKSVLLSRLIAADMAAGRSVLVIEPKADLIRDALDLVPPDRVDDVVLIDPTDRERSVGLNVLACAPHDAEVVADRFLHVLRQLYPDLGHRTTDVLAAGLLAITRAGDQTICELPVLLTNPTYRRRLLQRVGDPLALQPFFSWFESLSDAERLQVVSPSLNKLRWATYRRSIRGVLGQADAPFSMRSLFTERRLVFVNLAKGVIGPEAARLLGALIFSHAWQTALSRNAVDQEKRHTVSVYVDEFQDYVGGVATDFGEVLAQARGLGLALHLAHQAPSQIDATTRAAVYSEARSRVVFQTTGPDGAALARSLGGGLTAEDLQSLGSYEAYASVARRGASSAPMSISTLPPLTPLWTADAARARSREQFARPLDEVDAAILARRIDEPNESDLGGRRRRPS
jgi:hypothetical protein